MSNGGNGTRSGQAASSVTTKSCLNGQCLTHIPGHCQTRYRQQTHQELYSETAGRICDGFMTTIGEVVCEAYEWLHMNDHKMEKKRTKIKE